MIRFVKIRQEFYDLCKVNGVEKELMWNEEGRPSVLLVRMRYKNNLQDFAVPLRSNIPSNSPKNEYLPLPPRKTTMPRNRAGLHYIKIFPIHAKYVDEYIRDTDMRSNAETNILRKKEHEIIAACQNYLNKYEKGTRSQYTPDIDGILAELSKSKKKNDENKENSSNT